MCKDPKAGTILSKKLQERQRSWRTVREAEGGDDAVGELAARSCGIVII